MRIVRYKIVVVNVVVVLQRLNGVIVVIGCLVFVQFWTATAFVVRMDRETLVSLQLGAQQKGSEAR